MSHLAISGILIFISSLIAAVLVIFTKPRKQIHILWSLFSFSVASWGFGLFKGFTTDQSQLALFWARYLNLSAVFIPIFFLHFVICFTNRNNEKEKELVLYYCIIIGYFLLNIAFPGKFIPQVEQILAYKYYPVPGIFYYPFPLLFGVLAGYGIILLVKEWTRAAPLKRNQIKYLLVGVTVGFLGGSTTFLPVFGIKIYPLGTYFVPVYVLTVAYAIAKYRLLDITLVLRSGLVLAVYIAIVLAIMIPLNIIFKHSISLILVINIILLSSAPFMYQFLREKSLSKIDSVIFRGRYYYIGKLNKFIEDLTLIHEEKELFNNIISNLISILGTEKVAILTLEHVYNNYVIRAKLGIDNIENFRIPGDNTLVCWLKKYKGIFIKEEAEKLMAKDDALNINRILNSLEATICVPAILKEDLVGIITLGEKSSGQMYSHIDTAILRRLGTQFAIVMDYKRAELELRRKSEYEAVGKMAMEISHETRNLLAPVKTFIQSLHTHLGNPEFMGAFRQIVISNIDAMARKADDILFFAAGKKIDFDKDTEVNKILDNIVIGLQEKINIENITIVKELDNLPLITADKNLLLHIFTNIIINALDAMKGKTGKIRIRSQVHSAPTGQMQEICSRWIRVEVKDDGAGIPPEIKEKIFDAFVTTKSAGGSLQKHGVGLGLAVVKKAVDAHHGIISIESKVDKGTTFVVDLPVEENR